MALWKTIEEGGGLMRQSWVFLLCVVSQLIIVINVYAYIDPGTGSMIVQAVIAAIAAVSVSAGIFRHRLRSFFSRIFGRKNSEGHDSNDS